MSARYKAATRRAGVGIALLCSSCVIKLSSTGENVDAGAGKPNTVEPCSELDALPDADIQTAFEVAQAQFEAAGLTAGDVWMDPQGFDEFFRVAYKTAGCELPNDVAGEKQQALSRSERIDYCGPGRSTGLFFNSVSTCLNAACMRHDACYARCSAKTDFGCSWDGPTNECDRAFRAERQCEDDVRRFRSAGVRLLAALADAGGLSLDCAPNMICPGTGPCQLNGTSAACTRCLAAKDTGAKCLAASCADNADIESCYLATCDDVSGCFGGYDVPPDPPDAGNPNEEGNAGAGGAVDTGDGGGPPNSGATWTLVVVSAAIPPTDVDGSLWDADGAFSDPDPYLVVRAGSSNATAGVTPTVDDTRFPAWLAPVGLVSGTGSQFETYVSFRAMDADVIFDDEIGFCETRIAASDFGGEPKTFACFDAKGVQRFSVTYRLMPSG